MDLFIDWRRNSYVYASTVSVWAAAAVALALICTIHDDAPQMLGECSADGVIHMSISRPFMCICAG